jgi:hypothetical protein
VAQLLESAQKLSPLELARLLKRVADANIYLESRGTATPALALNDIFVEDQGLTRMANTAIAGPRAEDAHVADVRMLGGHLGELLREEDSGATRMRTLLGWMADTERVPPLTWHQIQDYAEQVEQQLTAPLATQLPAPTQHGHHPGQKKLPLAWIIVAVVALGFLVLMLSRSETPQVPPLRDLSGVVEIPAGSHRTDDGQLVELPAFRLGAYEVSIGQYAKFLEQLAALPASQRNAYDHPDQPEATNSHLPDEWDEMLAAAQQGGQWRNLTIDLNCPVVLVDWWDAYAYARWQRGRLPTQNEWHAALAKSPPGKTAAGYGPVDADPLDVTGNGLHGMAGNVAEWTHEDELDPSVPMTPRRPMLIGGSFRKPRDGVNAREWIEDRRLRRDDLGFRVLFEG